MQQIKAKRRAKKLTRQAPQLEETTQDLEVSLNRGEGIVRAQYDRDFRRFGETFANGDRASLFLTQILITADPVFRSGT